MAAVVADYPEWTAVTSDEAATSDMDRNKTGN